MATSYRDIKIFRKQERSSQCAYSAAGNSNSVNCIDGFGVIYLQNFLRSLVARRVIYIPIFFFFEIFLEGFFGGHVKMTNQVYLTYINPID
ncbi:hypothetical protein LF95_14600 [Thalassospira sp. TSL5-1]|nr:hypothetical protein LF95_14600 [Thalassospira sp. TSL5-1]